MNAVNATRSQKLGRTVLHEVLPVETPFLLGIFTGDVRNFKCRYHPYHSEHRWQNNRQQNEGAADEIWNNRY